MVTVSVKDLVSGTLYERIDAYVASGSGGKARLELNEERERKAFERVVGDLALTVSNITGFWTTLFSSVGPTGRLEVAVTQDTTVRWRGEIDLTRVSFSQSDKWVTFTAWSKNRMFWDRCKQTKVYKFDVAGLGYWVNKQSSGGSISSNWVNPTLDYDHQQFGTYFTSVPNFLSFQSAMTNLSEDGKIFYGLDITPFANRYIRTYRNAGDRLLGLWPPVPNPGSLLNGSEIWINGKKITNAGRFQDVMPDTTFEELLRAMMTYYNAEFYVDPATQHLMMVRRETGSGASRGIDDIAIGDTSAAVQWLTDDRFDYVKSYGVSVCPAPTLNTYWKVNVGPVRGLVGIWQGVLVEYILVGTVNGSARAQSEKLTFQLPGTLGVDHDGYTEAYYVRLNIPAIPGATDRCIYRRSIFDGAFHLILRTGGNSATTIDDNVGDRAVGNGTQLGPVDQLTWNYWKYDELTDLWSSPFTDLGGGTQNPAGKIFEAIPSLRFADANVTERRNDPFDTYSFFCGDQTFDTIRDSYKDLMRWRRGATIKVRATDFSVGDLVEAQTLPNDLTPDRRYIVRKVSADYLRRESTLTLMSV